jgi:hypothetical protein
MGIGRLKSAFTAPIDSNNVGDSDGNSGLIHESVSAVGWTITQSVFGGFQIPYENSSGSPEINSIAD